MTRRSRRKTTESSAALRPRSKSVGAQRPSVSLSFDMPTPTRRYDPEELVTPKGAAVPPSPNRRASTESPPPIQRRSLRSRSVSVGHKHVRFAHPIETPGNKRRRFSVGEMDNANPWILDGDVAAKKKRWDDQETEPIDNYRDNFEISRKVEVESDEQKLGRRPPLRATRSATSRNFSPDVNPLESTSEPMTMPVLTIETAASQKCPSPTPSTSSTFACTSDDLPLDLNLKAVCSLKYAENPRKEGQEDSGRWQIIVENVPAMLLTWIRTPNSFSFTNLEEDIIQIYQQYSYESGLSFVFLTANTAKTHVPMKAYHQLKEIFGNSTITPADDLALQKKPPVDQFLWTR